MKIINGLSDQPNQTQTLTLADGSKAVFSLTYRAQQLGWFWNLSWSGVVIANGQRLVASPNILRSFINKIPFGISVMTQGNVEPLNLEDLVDGTSEVVLLEGDDLAIVETAAFGAPAGQTQAIATTPSGIPAVIPPSSWGPAGGDLDSTYPNPNVRALHEGGGTQLPFGPIADGQILKRVGTGIIGVNAGLGDVVGPVGAVDGDIVLFNGTTGKLIKDGGNPANGSIAWFLNILKANRYSYTLQASGTGGAVVANLSSTNRLYFPLVTPLALTFAGFANEFKGVFIIQNMTGGPLAITWPACAISGDALPTSIAAGQIFTIPFEVVGTALGSVVLYYRAPAASSGGTVTSVTTAGRGILAGPNPIVGAGTINGFDANTFNVCDYGADPTGAADSYAAIAAAVAAGVATTRPFCLYGPQGIYKSSHKVTINGATTGAALAIKGDGQGVTQWLFTDAAADSGFVFNKATGGGSSSTDAPFLIRDCSIVCSAANQGTAILLNQTGIGSAGTQMSLIQNVGFFGDTNGSHYWNIGLDTFNWVYVQMDKCWVGCDTGWRIRGNTGITSVFWATNNNFQGGTYGIKADGTGGASHRIEGVYCQNNSFIQQQYAVWAENSNTGGGFMVQGGQINGASVGIGAGIHVAGFVGICIADIASLNPGIIGTSWTGIEILGSCWGAQISNCYISGLSGSGAVLKGVYISGGPAGAPQGYRNTVTACGFENLNAGAGSANVHFDSNVNASNCSNNVSDFAGGYVNAGGGGTANNFNNNI